MKLFFSVFLIILLSFQTQVFAKEYSFKQNSNTITISTTTSTAVVSYSLGSSALAQTTISIWTKLEPNGSLTGKVFGETANFVPGGPRTLTFTATGLLPNTTYYLGINNFPFQTEPYVLDPNTPVTSKTLSFKPDGSSMKVSGQIDATKNPYPELYDAKIEYSQDGTFTADVNQKPEGALSESSWVDDLNTKHGINHDGTYFFTLRSIDPVSYWYRETFYTKEGKLVGIPVIGKFSGSTGIELSEPTAANQDFEKRSYRLLAPLPGLSVLLDPSLCREQQIEHPEKGQICDINSFLNYLFRLLIGVAAVILVIRIIIEGFRYATTDVLSIKINSKEKLWQGVWGLLLALSAWLILNTINPKLVENEIDLPGVFLSLKPGDDGIGIDVPVGQKAAGQKLYLTPSSGQPVAVTACDSSSMATVTAFGTTFDIQKDLVPSIQRIDAKWRTLNPAYKIPMTVEDKSAMGGYICRNIADRSKLSYHAFGLAVDINPIENPQGSTLKTDMPAAFIKLWEDEHWGWGGRWGSSKDPMHFSKGINEGGNMKVN